MAKLYEFIEYLLTQVDNGIYIWGGQGEYITRDGVVYDKFHKAILSSDAKAWIKSKETSSKNADRAIKLYSSRIQKFKEVRCFDCSGLGMFWLYNLTKTASSDMTANGMKGKCEKITNLSDIRKGCWVFRVDSSGKATHVGYVVDNALNIVECKGRDYGVIKAPFNSKYWTAYGIPSYFADEIEEGIKYKVTFNRVLKKTSPYMKGDDVKALQCMLNEIDDAGLAVDGVFGSKTQKAVKAFQKTKSLKVDGKAGINTITALGGLWIA